MVNNIEYFFLNREKIYNLLTLAYEKVKFYNLNWLPQLPQYEDFTYEFFTKKIPILDKNFVRKNSEEFINQDYNKKSLYKESTSGTEGQPIICYRTQREQLKYAISQWNYRREFVKDLSPDCRFAHFYVFRRSEEKLVSGTFITKNNELLLPIFELSEKKLIQIWEKITVFMPRWIHGTPSMIYNLALVIEKYQLPKIHIDLIELVGEFVKIEYQKEIENIFQCNDLSVKSI